MRRTRVGAFCAATALLATISPRAAVAKPPADGAAAERDRAASLKKQGDAFLDGRLYADALAAYEESYALVPDPALLYNRGRALQFLARYPEALEAIERFAAEASPELLARVPGLATLRKELRARVSTVTVRSPVAGARVLVNERQLGVTPFAEALRLPAGRLVVDVYAEGYFPLHRELEAPGGTAIELDLPLVSRETSGFVSVRSHAEGTRIAIDGRPLGNTPAESGLLAGSHRVVASKAGHDDATTELVLRPGEKRELWLDPAERPALTSRWWFWAGVAAVVAGGVATVVLLRTEKEPSAGDYSPGLVRF